MAYAGGRGAVARTQVMDIGVRVLVESRSSISAIAGESWRKAKARHTAWLDVRAQP